MTNESGDYPFFGIDEHTFDKGKKDRLMLPAIQEAGRYLLRHLAKIPYIEYFAYECQVAALDVIESDYNKEVQFEVTDEHQEIPIIISAIFNEDGFISMRRRNRAGMERTHTLIQAGYLLGPNAIEHIEYDLSAYARIMEPAAEIRVREAILA